MHDLDALDARLADLERQYEATVADLRDALVELRSWRATGEAGTQRYLTTAEAAQRLGLRRKSVNNVIALGYLAAQRRGGRWEIAPAEVERYRVHRRTQGRRG